MTPEQFFPLVAGPLGALALLLYIAQVLWTAHRKEDDARDTRLVALDASNDKLADAVRDSTAVLRDLRDQERERLGREREGSRS